jgi:hypothetical protein
MINAVVAALSGATASGFLFWLLKEWLSTRLKASIQHEYDRKLEAFKAQIKTEQELTILDIKTALAREAAFHAAAHASFAEGQKAAMERKLGAIDKLWQGVVRFRDGLPPALAFIDVLTVDEYAGAKDHPTFRELTADLLPDRLEKLVPQGIEETRPYIGEYMWAVFYCYRALLIRILMLLQLGRTDAEKIEWHRDSGNRGLLKAVLTPAELEEFDKTQFGKVTWIKQRLESKLLAAAQQVISGKSFGADSLEQARAIQLRVAQLSALGQSEPKNRS